MLLKRNLGGALAIGLGIATVAAKSGKIIIIFIVSSDDVHGFIYDNMLLCGCCRTESLFIQPCTNYKYL